MLVDLCRRVCVCVCVCVLYKEREFRFCGFGLSFLFKLFKSNVSRSIFPMSLTCSTRDSERDFVIAVFFPFFMHEIWERCGKRRKEKRKKFPIVVVYSFINFCVWEKCWNCREETFLTCGKRNIEYLEFCLSIQ